MSAEQNRSMFDRTKTALIAPVFNHYINSTPEFTDNLRVFPANGREGTDFVKGEYFYRHSVQNEGKAPVLIYHPLGNARVAVEIAAKMLNIKTFASLRREIIIDSPIAPAAFAQSDRDLGRRYMPEQMCGPIHSTCGYLMTRQKEFEELKNRSTEGTENLYPLFLTDISAGTCREKEYAPLEEAALSDRYAEMKNGSPFDFYGVPQTSMGLRKLVLLLANLGHTDPYHAILAINTGIQRTKVAEELDRFTLWKQSMMEKSAINDAEKLLDEAKDKLASDLDSSPEMIFTECTSLIEELPRIRPEPIGQILISGEIFQCAELASSSYNLARLLVERGFYPYVDVGLGHYLDKFELTPKRIAMRILQEKNPRKEDTRKIKAAIAGLTRMVGGHAEDVAADTAGLRESNYDGMIVAGPFLCLPHIIVKNIIIYHKDQPLNEDKSPKNTLIVEISDQSSATGMITRVEAFLDPIERLKRTPRRPIVAA